MAKSLNDIRRRRQVLNMKLVQTVCNYEAQRFMHSPLEIRRWPLKGMEEEERIKIRMDLCSEYFVLNFRHGISDDIRDTGLCKILESCVKF